MIRQFYYSSRKVIIYIFSAFFLTAIAVKFILAPFVIPRSIPVKYMSLVFAVLLSGLIAQTALSKKYYQYTLLFFLTVFSIYSVFEARYFLPLYYTADSLLSLFYLLYLFQFLAVLAIGGYFFKYYISLFFPAITIIFLIILQPKMQILTVLLYSFIVFVNVYTYVLFLLLRFVTNQNKQLTELNEKQQSTMKKLTTARNKIVEQEKMASIATFSAGLAHEINNPVNYMYGNLHFLEKYHAEFQTKWKTVEDKQLQTYINDMGKILERYREGFDRIIQIIDTMKHAFPKNKNQQQRENISLIIENAVSIISKSVSSDISFEKEIQNDLFYECNASDILTLTINILANAVDAVNYIEREKKIYIGARCTETFLEIQIRDNGKGIEKNLLTQVFEPFFSTKDSKGNIGIGLTLCKGIVSRYSGQFHIKSEPDRFTIISIELPTAAVELEVPPQ